MKRDTKRHLTENEVIFREANKDVQQFLQDTGTTSHTKIAFYCECSHQNCRGRIELTPAEYGMLHQSKRQFIVKPGHEIPEIEWVVRHGKDFNVVEKHGEIPSGEDIDEALQLLGPLS